MRHASLATAAVLLVAGCATPSYIGDGPVRLSPEVRAYYQQYRRQVNPLAFAVSRDGRAAGAVVCPQFGGCRGNEIDGALRRCRESGKECFIYDLGGEVVWRDADVPGVRI